MDKGKRAVRLLQSFARASALGMALVFGAAGLASADTPPAPDSVSDNAATASGRTIRLSGEITRDVATDIVDKLRALSEADPHAEIVMRINSVGGEVNQGLAIADTMASIPNDIRTVCEGEADSMAAFLLAMGTPGKREALPHCEVMIHQPSGGSQGKNTDMNIDTELGNRQRAIMDSMLAARTGWSQQFIHDLTERDLYLSTAEAKDLGLIDTILPARAAPAPSRLPQVPASLCSSDRNYLIVCRLPHTPR
jgi:ATP-dependent Clp protease protease subunit